MFPAAILYGLAELLIPELARCNAAGSTGRIRHLTERSLLLALIYGCFCGGLLFLSADVLCVKLYKTAEAGKYLRWFAILAPMLYCDAMVDAMTKGLGKQKICVRYNIITSALDVILLYLLLPRYGMAGYFFSFLVTHVINFGLSLRLLLKVTGPRLPLHVPLLAFSAAVAAVWCAGQFQSIGGQITAFTATFFSLLFLLKVAKKEDILWLRGLLRGKTSTASI